MHATTLGQLSQVLGGYVAPGQSFAPSLNQALEAIYGFGVWRDLTVEGSFDCSAGYFTLPPEGDTVLYAVVDNEPATVRALWHDYRATGFDTDALLRYGLVDDGYRPTMRDIAEDTRLLHVVPAATYANGTAFSEANGGLIELTARGDTAVYAATAAAAGPPVIWVTGTLTSGGTTAVEFPALEYNGLVNTKRSYRSAASAGTTVYWDSVNSRWVLTHVDGGEWRSNSAVATPDLATGWTAVSPATGTPIVAAYPAIVFNSVATGTVSVDLVESIRFEQLEGVYDLRTDPLDPTTTVATMGPGNGVARYRRYRVPKAQTGTYAHILCKRRFMPVADDNDLVYISHTGALKHALLAVLAEDNADLERAEIHWGKCRQLLDEQLDQYRGPARPALDLQLYGDSVRPMRGHY